MRGKFLNQPGCGDLDGEQDPRERPRKIVIGYLPEIIFCLAAAIALILLYDIPLTHDVVWQFWIARQMMNGAVLYRDVWETNPPLWFWSAVPINYAATWLCMPPLQLLVVGITGMGALPALVVGHLSAFRSPIARLAVMLLSFWLGAFAGEAKSYAKGAYAETQEPSGQGFRPA